MEPYRELFGRVDTFNYQFRSTYHPGIKFDGAFYYEWSQQLRGWILISIATWEKYGSTALR